MLGLLMWNLLPIANAAAADDSPAGDTASQASMKVAVGLAGVWKIGHVTPVKVELPDALDQDARTIEVQTFDGDGVPVTYRQAIHRDASKSPGESSQYWTMVTIGRSDRSMKVTVSNESGSALSTEVLGPEQLGRPLPTIQPWIVALGSSLGVEATGITQTDTGLPNFTTTVLDTADQLPDQWRGLSACDVLILSGAPGKQNKSSDSADKPSTDKPLVEQLAAAQWKAIEDWCQHGGTTIISLGQFATQMPANAPLNAFLPGPVTEHLTNIDSGTLESATATKIRLGPITAERLGEVRGRVELAMVDNGARRFPWWVRYSMGKGIIHCIASDLDQPVLKNWPDRRLVWDKLLSGFWSREERRDSASNDRNISGSSFLGTTI